MIFSEPAPTQGDIHFRVLGIPVRIHPFFWVVGLLLSLRGETPPERVLTWIVAMFISILIHELGHAFMQRRFGGRPRIVLHGMGGLAICGDCDRSSRSQMLISFAGPGAGFLFAAAIVVLVGLLGRGIGVVWQGNLTREVFNEYKQPDTLGVLGFVFYWESFASPLMNRMLKDLLWINILWGAVNLLPIYPLDGGQISREVCQISKPREGVVLSLQISMIAAVGMAIVGLSWGSLYVVILFGYLAYSSYKTLEAYRASLW